MAMISKDDNYEYPVTRTGHQLSNRMAHFGKRWNADTGFFQKDPPVTPIPKGITTTMVTYIKEANKNDSTIPMMAPDVCTIT